MGGRMVLGPLRSPAGASSLATVVVILFRRGAAKMARRRVHKEGWRDAIPF